MNIVKRAKIALVTGFVTATLITQPFVAQAQEAVIDQVITVETQDAAADFEWKYLPVRR